MSDLSGQLSPSELLEIHTDTIRRMLIEIESADPVGFIIDATDRLGGVLARVLIAAHDLIPPEQADAKLTRLRAEYRSRGETLTVLGIADLEGAEAMMQVLSRTPSETLKRIRAEKGPGEELVIVIAKNGYTPAMFVINRPVSDGQHRTSTVPWKAAPSNFCE